MPAGVNEKLSAQPGADERYERRTFDGWPTADKDENGNGHDSDEDEEAIERARDVPEKSPITELVLEGDGD